MADYVSSHTGEEIDEAVDAVKEAAKQTDLASLAVRVTTLENQSNKQSIDETVYTAIRGNVNTLRLKINALISAVNGMANYAFENGKPSIEAIGEMSWPSSEGLVPVLTSPSSINYLGIMASDEDSITKQVLVKGNNLTTALQISITGDGFSVSPGLVGAAQANAGTYVNITYHRDSSQSSNYPATGTLKITSYGDGVGGNYSVLINVQVEGDTSPLLTSPSGQIDFGTLAAGVPSKTMQVYIKGSNLTKPLTLAITEGDGLLSGFALATATVSAADANAGTNVNITYNRASSANAYVGTGKLSITSEDGIDEEFDLRISVNSSSAYTDPYEQDNLLLHLDGRNMGSETGKWKDGGRNIVFELTSEPTTDDPNVEVPSVVSDGIVTRGVNFSTDGQFAVCDDTTLRDSLNYANCLIEVCFTVGNEFLKSGSIRPFFVTNLNNKIACIFGYANQNGYKHLDYRTSGSETGNAWVVENAGSNNFPGGETLFKVSMSKDTLVINGQTYDDTPLGQAIAPLPSSGDPALPILVGGRRTESTQYGVTTRYHRSCHAIIHDVRIYNISNLSEDQVSALISYNQGIDDRYGSSNS